MPIQSCLGEGHIAAAANGKATADTAESETLCMRGHLDRENREVLLVSIPMPASCARASVERSENASDGKSDMNANRNSDDFVVLSTRGNKAGSPVADRAEERRSPKGSAITIVDAPDTEPDKAFIVRDEGHDK